MKLSFKTEGDRVIVTIKGKLTLLDVEAQKETFQEAVTKWADKEWILDCKDLTLISSSGLRWLWTLRKGIPKKISLVDVQKPVMDILIMHFAE